MEVNVNLNRLLRWKPQQRPSERQKDETLISILALVKISIRELCFFPFYLMPYKIKVNGQYKISYSCYNPLRPQYGLIFLSVIWMVIGLDKFGCMSSDKIKKKIITN